VALGHLGASSSRAVAGGWTAIAYPEQDLIRLEHENDTALSMVCYYPIALAWAGTSLIVSTADREVLLFEHLRDAIEAKRKRAPDDSPGGPSRMAPDLS
jgi:hypothetical protein